MAGLASAWAMGRQRPKEYRRKVDAATRCFGVCPPIHDLRWSAHRSIRIPRSRIGGYSISDGRFYYERVVGGKRYEARCCGAPDSFSFGSAKRPDDTADYCLGCSFSHSATKHWVPVFTVQCTGTRALAETMDEQNFLPNKQQTGPISNAD